MIGPSKIIGHRKITSSQPPVRLKDLMQSYIKKHDSFKCGQLSFRVQKIDDSYQLRIALTDTQSINVFFNCQHNNFTDVKIKYTNIDHEAISKLKFLIKEDQELI